VPAKHPREPNRRLREPNRRRGAAEPRGGARPAADSAGILSRAISAPAGAARCRFRARSSLFPLTWVKERQRARGAAVSQVLGTSLPFPAPPEATELPARAGVRSRRRQARAVTAGRKDSDGGGKPRPAEKGAWPNSEGTRWRGSPRSRPSPRPARGESAGPRSHPTASRPGQGYSTKNGSVCSHCLA